MTCNHEHATHHLACDCREAHFAALQAERDALAAIVEKYARHDGLCAIIGGYGYCTCGLDAARKALGEG